MRNRVKTVASLKPFLYLYFSGLGVAAALPLSRACKLGKMLSWILGVIGIKPHQFSPPSEQLSYMKAGDFVARVWVGVAEPQLNVDESGGDP